MTSKKEWKKEDTHIYVGRDREGREVFRVRVYSFCTKTNLMVSTWNYLPAGSSLDDARRRRQRVYDDLSSGRGYDPARFERAASPKFGEFVAEYRAELERNRLAPKTLEAFDLNMRPWVEALGKVELSDLEYADFARVWKDVLDSDLKASTKRRRRHELKRILKVARARGLTVDRNFAEGLPSEGKDVRQDRPKLTEEQVYAIVRQAHLIDAESCVPRSRRAECRYGLRAGNQRKGEVTGSETSADYVGHGACLQLQYELGRRPGEPLNLKWSDVDFDGRTIVFRNMKPVDPRTGGRVQMRFHLTDAHAQLLRSHLGRIEEFGRAAMKPSNGCRLVFPSQVGDVSHTGSRYRKVWGRACRAAGVVSGRKNGGYTPHDLRHAATREVNRSHGRGVAKDFVGHKDDKTAHHYDGAIPRELQEVAEARSSRHADLAAVAFREVGDTPSAVSAVRAVGDGPSQEGRRVSA